MVEERQNMETLEDKQFLQIHDKWKDICNTQNSRRIIRFWNQHSAVLASRGSWYLKICILNNDIPSLTVMLDHARSLSCVDRSFGYGIHHNYTPILYAARYAHFRTIQLLCSKGADICLPTNANILEYIFENSAIKDHNVIPCVEFVVTLGCTVPCNSIWCLSYYNSQKKFDRVHLATFLRQYDADLIHITTAIKYGHFRLAKWLIRNKCKIYNTYLTDVKSEEGISLLVENGIQNIDHNDTVYGTALFYHSQRGNIDAVTALLNHGANHMLLCTNDNLTALQIATQNENADICQMLIKQEATKRDQQKPNNNNNITKLQRINSMKYNVDFSKLPNKPSQLRKDIELEQTCFDETNANAVLIENKIEALQIKLKKEYKTILQLRKEQNDRNDNIEKWESSVHHWNEFVLHWIKWDILCFVEWLKRINCWKRGTFETYFKSDQDAVRKIGEILFSDPLTFGIGNNNTDDDDDDTKCDDTDDGLNTVTFGKQLRAFDRYTLFKIGINDTSDCNAIANEIQQLWRKSDKETKGGTSKGDDELCVICWEREKTHVLNCGHRFCEPDIRIVRTKSNLCPICKAKITIVIKLY